METILQIAHRVRIELVTKESIREELAQYDNLESLKTVCQQMIEEIKPKMHYAGTRQDMLDTTIELMSQTLDLEFLIEQIDLHSTIF